MVANCSSGIDAMPEDLRAKRELIKNALIAATTVGLAMAATSASAQTSPKPTAAPAVVSPGPTTVPRIPLGPPPKQPRGEAPQKAASAPKN
jgi:hypothetical protein